METRWRDTDPKRAAMLMEVLTLYLYTRGAARTLSGSTQIDFIGKSDTCSQLATRVKRRISDWRISD